MTRKRKRQTVPIVYRCSGCGSAVFDSDEPGTHGETRNASDNELHSCSRANLDPNASLWEGTPPTFFHAEPGVYGADPRKPMSTDAENVERWLVAEVLSAAGFRGWIFPRDAAAVVRSYTGSKVWHDEDEALRQAMHVTFGKIMAHFDGFRIRATPRLVEATAGFTGLPSFSTLFEVALAVFWATHQARRVTRA